MDRGQNDRIFFAEFELDMPHRRLLRDGEPVHLYAKAFDLLAVLIARNGTVVSKGELMDKIWPDQFVEEANLTVQISALRKALGETKNHSRFLVTVPGVGYKFVGDVRPSEDELVEEPIEKARVANEVQRPGEERPGELVPAAPESRRSWIVAAAALALVATIGIGGYLYLNSNRDLRITSLAVLPFESQEQNPESEYLGEGLAESVIYSLSGVADLRVMSRNSTFRYRAREHDARQIGRELDVDAVLTGRIVNLGNNLSISTELISTADNSVIWGGQFTRNITDAERLQTDIARSIADRLKLKLSFAGKSLIERSHTAEPEAYQLYLAGRHHLNKFTDEGFQKGRDYFERAIQKDPNYALAHAALAEAYSRLCGYNAMASSECFPKSRIAAERALELDEGLAVAHAMLGSVRHFYDWDWQGAEKEFKRAIELDPNDSNARHLYSYFLTSHGRFEESLKEMRLANELDPFSIEKSVGIAEILYFEKRLDEALAEANRTLELDRNAGFVHWVIGNIYVQKGMRNEAIAHYEKAIPLSGNSPDEQATLAYAHALAGRKDEARRILDALKQRSKRQFISPCVLAIVHAGLGEKDEAFELFEKAYGGRDFMLTLLKVEPMYDRLRDDPRYADLMRRVGFE